MILALDKQGKLTRARGQRPVYKRRAKGEMNATEAAYYAHLQLLLKCEAISAHTGFEPGELILGKRRYTPDFQVASLDGSVRLIDVKGTRLTKKRRIPRPWIEPQDRLRIEAMARAHPWFTFVLTWRHKGQWFEETIAPELAVRG